MKTSTTANRKTLAVIYSNTSPHKMKTISQIKFDSVIKEGFQELLKPLGFKKKANNFYLQLDTLGQIINVQKSAWGNKDNISYNKSLEIHHSLFAILLTYSSRGSVFI